jgi:hypothetical protein
MSFPQRISRDSLGPTLGDTHPVVDPTRAVPAAAFNAAFWTVTGCGLMIPLASVLCTVIDGALVVVEHAEAWNPNQILAGPTAMRDDPGCYSFTYLSTYPDENGVERAVNLTKGRLHFQGGGYGESGLPIGWTQVSNPHCMIVRICEPGHGDSIDAPFLAEFG